LKSKRVLKILLKYKWKTPARCSRCMVFFLRRS